MPSERKTVDNIQTFESEGYALVSVNSKLYALDVVYSAGYSLLDKVYVMLDGDPEKEILVRLRPKGEGGSLEQLGRDFNNELLKYATYKVYSEQNKDIRWMIVEKSLQTNCGCADSDDGGSENFQEDPLGITKPWEGESKEEGAEDNGQGKEEGYIDDPSGIAKSWEETHKEEKKDE